MDVPKAQSSRASLQQADATEPAIAQSPVLQTVQSQQSQLNSYHDKRRIVVDLSSLPLQIFLHLNVYFFIFYWVIELLLYVYKGLALPYPDLHGTFTLEIVLLFLVAFIEGFRLFFGYKGNLGERKQALVWSIILALPILVSQLYLILWQTYVLRIEVIFCAIFFVLVALEVLLSVATVWTFQRHETFVHS